MEDFFNKVVAGVNRGVKNIKNSSDIFLEKAEIKTQISETNNEISSYLYNLGTMVYNFYKEGSLVDTRMAAIVDEIDNCYGKIDELNQKLEALSAPQNTNNDENVSQNSFCSNCGNPVDPDSNFCVRCGAKLK